MALAPFRDFVGDWRGVGQPQRGSTRRRWIEQGQWEWRFDGGRATLTFQSPEGKVIREAKLQPTEETGIFELAVSARRTAATGDAVDGDVPKPTLYRGKLDDGRLIVTAEDPPVEFPARITIGLVAEGDRLVMLLERRSPAGQRYTRLAEVGYTREGSKFGKGSTQPECVVTGGHASMAVEYNGKTYYVCCGGCRDLFNDDPEKVLAEYRERKAAEKEEAANN